MKKVIVYIDGFNLYYGIKSLNKKYLKWLDLQKLAQSFIDDKSILMEVKYFTAMVSGNIEKENKQKHYLNVLEYCCDKLNIIQGHFLSKSILCHNCNAVKESFEEKQSDVNLSCELLADAYENKFDVAFVVSADSDLTTPIKKAIQFNKIVIVAKPPNRKSYVLKKNATNFFSINANRLKKCLLPAKITINNKELIAPQNWRKNV